METKLSDDLAADRPLRLKRIDGQWHAVPTAGRRSGRNTVLYGQILATWWRTSPSAVLECAECGDIRLTGKKTAKTCGCSKAGRLVPMDLDDVFEQKRPRRKKVKL